MFSLYFFQVVQDVVIIHWLRSLIIWRTFGSSGKYAKGKRKRDFMNSLSVWDRTTLLPLENECKPQNRKQFRHFIHLYYGYISFAVLYYCLMIAMLWTGLTNIEIYIHAAIMFVKIAFITFLRIRFFKDGLDRTPRV